MCASCSPNTRTSERGQVWPQRHTAYMTIEFEYKSDWQWRCRSDCRWKAVLNWQDWPLQKVKTFKALRCAILERMRWILILALFCSQVFFQMQKRLRRCSCQDLHCILGTEINKIPPYNQNYSVMSKKWLPQHLLAWCNVKRLHMLYFRDMGITSLLDMSARQHEFLEKDFVPAFIEGSPW